MIKNKFAHHIPGFLDLAWKERKTTNQRVSLQFLGTMDINVEKGGQEQLTKSRTHRK